MNTLRKIVLSLLVFGLGWLLFLNSSALVARQTILDRSVTKSWLSEGKVYDNFVDELAKLVEKQQSEKSGPSSAESDSKIDTAALTRAAKAAFPPDVLQENVETVLTSAYDWLEGKTDKLVFSLDLADEKATFVEALGNEASSKLSSLPACTNEQISEDFDPFSASCLPTGTDINAQVAQLKNEVASSDSILPDTSLSSEDIKVNIDGEQQTIDQAFSEAPRWYGWFKSSPLLLGCLILINGVLIFLLSRPKLNGLKKLAWTFGPVGIALLLFGSAGKLMAAQLAEHPTRIGGGGDGIAENMLGPLAAKVGSSISTWNLVIGGVYLFIAAICLTIYLILKKKNPDVSPKVEAKKEVEAKESNKEVKKPPLIQ